MNDASPASSSPPTRRARALVALAFWLAAFIHANLWGGIIPLWQIPDEAAHFEYVHLLTRLGRRPTPADADPALQAAMLRSMWENRYWEYLGYRRPEQPPTRILPGGWTAGGPIPDTAVVGDAFVGAFSQLQNPTPVYYALLALVQALVIDQPIDDQLRALRLASRVIFALGVMFIVLTAGELFAWRWPAVIAAGLFSTLQPMFTYIGSGLNNDNGVMFFTALLTWQLARGWRRGYPWPRLLLILALTILAIYAKRTAVFLVLWAPLVLGVWWVQRVSIPRRRMLAIAGGVAVALSIAGGALYALPAHVPNNWLSDSSGPAWTNRHARSGERAFVIARSAGAPPTTLRPYAPLQIPIGLPSSDTAITWSAWVKGSVGSRGALRIEDNDQRVSQVEFDAMPERWQLVSVTHPLTRTTYRLNFIIVGLSSAPVYLDDLSVWTDAGRSLPLPNGSAEEPRRLLAEVISRAGHGLGVGAQAERLIRDYRSNLAALPERLGPAVRLFNWTFWGRFGIFARARNPDLPPWAYTALPVMAGLGIASVGVQIARRRQLIAASGGLTLLFLAGLVLAAIQAFMPLLVFAASRTWLPQGRYLFSAMPLFACIMALGWIDPWPGRWKWLAVAVVGGGFAWLTLLAATVCMSFFRG
jgi:4-amino-4-deoxy-L-arabinose transferase-like glycosyltransferase